MKNEIKVIKQKVGRALSIAQEITIQDEKTLADGIDFLKKIKTTGKIIKNQKEKITKPLLQAIKEARAMFKPIEDNYSEAERIIKGKILHYNIVQEEKRKEKEAKLAARVEKGTMKAETAVKKIEEIPEVKNEGKVGKVSTRTVKKVVIEDESKLPRKYLIPNQSLIRQDALKGIKIDGVEIKEEKIIASL